MLFHRLAPLSSMRYNLPEQTSDSLLKPSAGGCRIRQPLVFPIPAAGFYLCRLNLTQQFKVGFITLNGYPTFLDQFDNAAARLCPVPAISETTGYISMFFKSGKMLCQILD